MSTSGRRLAPFKSFKSFNRCAPFRSLEQVRSKSSNRSDPSNGIHNWNGWNSLNDLNNTIVANQTLNFCRGPTGSRAQRFDAYRTMKTAAVSFNERGAGWR